MNGCFRFYLILLLGTLFNQLADAQTARQNYERTRTFDVQHYLIRTSFDRRNKTISGETTISLKPLKSGFREVVLDAANLNFESIRLEPEALNLAFETEADRVIIKLDRAYSPENLLKINLKYSAKPRKGVYFVDARRDGGTLLHDAQIWTQGETAETRHWFPAYDFPDDKATTEQFLTVEPDETAIANGELIETLRNADGTKTFHFKMMKPHSVYLTSFVVGKYVKFTDSYKNIPLTVYLYPGKEYLYQKVFADTRAMMKTFEELTGIEYPFNKYDQTIVGQFKLGGMENITSTTLSDRDIFFSDRNRLVVEDIISHELAHSWFGNLATCRNWSELWLNEGFATFMEAAWREKTYGRDDYLRKIAEDRDTYFAEESRMSRKHGLFNGSARPDDSIFDAVTYQKGGAVVHTLRETVGERAFWLAINKYLDKYRFANVETGDLQKVFESTSKVNLEWFFKQWVYGAGYPRLEIKYQYDAQTRRLNLNVRQTQIAEDSTPAVFILPLDVDIKTVAGVTREKISITKRQENFSLKADEAPIDILIDKNLKIPLMTVKIQK